jgi:hypothetical protein
MRRSAWQGAGVLFSFVHTRVAVLVRHWFEIGLTDGVLEHGARLELRLLEPQAHRGTESAAQRFVIDRPVWRADLFDRLDRPAGTFSAAHFHPRFDGDEPSDRVFKPEITADPWAWAFGDDARDVRDQAAAIVDTARALAPTACRSRDQCFRLTRDVAETVRIMVDNLADPALLDPADAKAWLDAANRGR